MASDTEDLELESLRSAVLASLKSKPTQDGVTKSTTDGPSSTRAEEEEEDDEEAIHALRLAALKSKRETGVSSHISTPVSGSPLHPSQPAPVPIPPWGAGGGRANLITIPLQDFSKPPPQPTSNRSASDEDAVKEERGTKFSRFQSSDSESGDSDMDDLLLQSDHRSSEDSDASSAGGRNQSGDGDDDCDSWRTRSFSEAGSSSESEGANRSNHSESDSIVDKPDSKPDSVPVCKEGDKIKDVHSQDKDKESAKGERTSAVDSKDDVRRTSERERIDRPTDLRSRLGNRERDRRKGDLPHRRERRDRDRDRVHDRDRRRDQQKQREIRREERRVPSEREPRPRRDNERRTHRDRPPINEEVLEARRQKFASSSSLSVRDRKIPLRTSENGAHASVDKAINQPEVDRNDIAKPKTAENEAKAPHRTESESDISLSSVESESEEEEAIKSASKSESESESESDEEVTRFKHTSTKADVPPSLQGAVQSRLITSMTFPKEGPPALLPRRRPAEGRSREPWKNMDRDRTHRNPDGRGQDRDANRREHLPRHLTRDNRSGSRDRVRSEERPPRRYPDLDKSENSKRYPRESDLDKPENLNRYPRETENMKRYPRDNDPVRAENVKRYPRDSDLDKPENAKRYPRESRLERPENTKRYPRDDDLDRPENLKRYPRDNELDKPENLKRYPRETELDKQEHHDRTKPRHSRSTDVLRKVSQWQSRTDPQEEGTERNHKPGTESRKVTSVRDFVSESSESEGDSASQALRSIVKTDKPEIEASNAKAEEKSVRSRRDEEETGQKERLKERRRTEKKSKKKDLKDRIGRRRKEPSEEQAKAEANVEEPEAVRVTVTEDAALQKKRSVLERLGSAPTASSEKVRGSVKSRLGPIKPEAVKLTSVVADPVLSDPDEAFLSRDTMGPSGDHPKQRSVQVSDSRADPAAKRLKLTHVDASDRQRDELEDDDFYVASEPVVRRKQLSKSLLSRLSERPSTPMEEVEDEDVVRTRHQSSSPDVELSERKVKSRDADKKLKKKKKSKTKSRELYSSRSKAVAKETVDDDDDVEMSPKREKEKLRRRDVWSSRRNVISSEIEQDIDDVLPRRDKSKPVSLSRDQWSSSRKAVKTEKEVSDGKTSKDDALEKRIRKIKAQNAAILQRQQEIEKEKKMFAGQS